MLKSVTVEKVLVVAAGVLVAGAFMTATKNIDFIRKYVHSGFDS